MMKEKAPLFLEVSMNAKARDNVCHFHRQQKELCSLYLMLLREFGRGLSLRVGV